MPFDQNDDWENWTDRMAVFGDAPADLVREVTPRPGHADLLGVLKNDQTDCRNILERSSARETAIRVAASGIAVNSWLKWAWRFIPMSFPSAV